MISLVGKSLVGIPDGCTDICTAAGDGIDIQGVEGCIKGIIISGQRTHEKRGPGKGQQADPVTFQSAYKISDGKFCPLKSVGVYILDQHGS